jgi:chemosensory pili system protein ChpA (sensor histidine kinase/response regulator)
LPAGATVLRASEAVVQKLINRPQSIDEDACAKSSVRRLPARLHCTPLGRQAVSAMAMFPQYEALVSRVGGGHGRARPICGARIGPRCRSKPLLAPPEGVTPRAPDAATVDDFEMGLLADAPQSA